MKKRNDRKKISRPGRERRKMTLFRKFWILFAVICFAGCSGASIQNDYDPQTNFTVLKTYDWGESGEDSGINDLDMARVTEAVNRHLNAKGYKKNSNHPDFLVTALFVVKDNTRAAGTDVSVQSDTFAMSKRSKRASHKVGTLILNFLEADSNMLLWQGAAGDVLKAANTPEKRQERINAAVAGILDQFPPR